MDLLNQIRTLAAQGVKLKDAEAFIGRAFTPDEATAFRKAATARRLQRAAEAAAAAKRRREEAERRERDNIAAQLAGTSWPEPRKAKTDLERQHEHRARARELGEFPWIAHPTERWMCGLSLLRFGLRYCLGEGKMLKRPPSPRMIGFVKALETTIRYGGNRHVRWPRGKGKSTWVKIAALWALVYGYRHFVVIVAATKPMAEEETAELWRFCTEDPLFAADFPEIAMPLADVALTPQRMRVQTYKGRKTHITDNTRFSYKRFAAIPGMPHTGGILAARGADQAIRGLNIGSARPDFVFIDDPQTDDAAKSPAQVEKIEDRIQGALIGLGETNRIIAAVMASTPIEPDDVSERYADPERHPEWITTTERFVYSWGPEDWRDRYLAEVRKDNLNRDVLLTLSRHFYQTHRAEIEKGAAVLDDSDFDPALEISAYQHALNMLHIMKPKRFNSEMQMKPTRAQGVFRISASDVSKRLNGYPMLVVPPECDQGAVAFCDVNAVAGLRWAIMAFGAGRVTAIVAYGSYPPTGRLFPEGTPESAVPRFLAPALRAVAKGIQAANLRTVDGEPVRVRGLCFDGGWQTETVALVCQELDGKCGMSVCWSKGYSAKEYSYYHHEKARAVKNLRAAEMCHTWATANGIYLALNSDYWREMAQTAFLASPLQPSSCSFWGNDALTHYNFADEVCAESLVGKSDHPRYGTVWEWKKTGPNHFGDVLYGCMAYGAIRGNFDSMNRLAATDDMQRVAKARKVRYVYRP